MRNLSIPVFFDEKSANSAQYQGIIQGIHTAATRFGYRLHMISDKAAVSVDYQSLPPVAIITGADMPFMKKTIDELRRNHCYAVLAGTNSEQFGSDVSCATPSRRKETQQLVSYLWNAGKKKLALVGFGLNSISDNFRYHAAMSAFASFGIPISQDDTWLWDKDPESVYEDFIQKAAQYDAVICPNDIIAISLIRKCMQNQIRVPQDLFVASFGNMTIGRCFSPSVTTVTMELNGVGEQALLVWRFLMTNESARGNSIVITVPSRILVRESTAFHSLPDGNQVLSASLAPDSFYHIPSIAVLQSIENCLSQRDQTDLKLIDGILKGTSYEELAEELFMSVSTLRYRLNKTYTDASVASRREFERLITQNLGQCDLHSLLMP